MGIHCLISQEERIDLITYTVEMSPDGEVIIKDRKDWYRKPRTLSWRMSLNCRFR